MDTAKDVDLVLAPDMEGAWVTALDGRLKPSFYSKSSKLLPANREMIIVKKEDWLKREIDYVKQN